MRVKVSYPKQYGQPYNYTVTASLDDVKQRVEHDLAAAQDALFGIHINQRAVGDTITVTNNVGQDYDADDLYGPLKVQVDLHTLHVDKDDLNKSYMNYSLYLNSAIENWAQRSRVTGVRGDRFYAIEDPYDEASDSTSYFTAIDPTTNTALSDRNLDGTFIWDYDREVILRLNLLIGTTVFYSDRRSTICYPNTPEQAAQCLENLVEHVIKLVPDIGVVVKFDRFGEFRYGV